MTDSITIPLSKTGKNAGLYEAIISPEDADLALLNWIVSSERAGTIRYAYRVLRLNGKRPKMILHRVILERIIGRPLAKDEMPDHINGDGLDNRRENLRLATNSQNQANRGKQRNSTSGYKGVFKHKTRWQASIAVDSKRIYLGSFETPELAYAAYCEAAKKYHKEFANIGTE